MTELLVKIDEQLASFLPSILVTTLIMICPKAIGQVNYSWLVAAFPIIAYIISAGVINFLLLILSIADTGDEDE